jgi:hypothetical protein
LWLVLHAENLLQVIRWTRATLSTKWDFRRQNDPVSVLGCRLYLLEQCICMGQGFCAHGSQCSLHFWIFENFRFSYFSAFKNYDIKYVDRCVYEDWNQKSLVKKYVIFLKMQKRQISGSTLTKYTYYCTTIYSQKFVFFVFSKIQSIF